jgi:hypothetical protein
VISRKKENLNAPAEEKHISSALMHLANASYRLGRTIHFDPRQRNQSAIRKPRNCCGTGIAAIARCS